MKMRRVEVNDRMQSGYVYFCTEPIGKNFDPAFQPELTPPEMLELGVFGGKYMTDCKGGDAGVRCVWREVHDRLQG